jgi:anti-sigma regulatory factor (Ser/Thr protein kinase)
MALHRASTFAENGKSGAEMAPDRAMPDSRGPRFAGITPVYRQTEVPASPSRSRSQGARLPVPTNDAMYHTYRSDLSEVRALVLERAREAGLAEGRASDLVLAVSEVAANTLRHTKSSGTLAIWHNEREIVCEIRDEGMITDPLAGQVKPAPDATGGHGLWLVYQVCDFVELNSDASGTTIRMHMALSSPNGGR